MTGHKAIAAEPFQKSAALYSMPEKLLTISAQLQDAYRLDRDFGL
ncbi:hypothetical protein [Thalassoporum mexicanum]|nr:hypothetical protein [Pseudanabaena sp. PCC 7367]